ncbi:MAG: hypothetical protein ABIK43_04110 [candidate division WOR-3 bacterium]
MAKTMPRIGARYYLKLKYGSQHRTDQNIRLQADNYWRGYEPVHVVDMQVKELLMQLGVSMLQYVPFANFARQVGRFCRQHGSLVQQAGIAELVSRYQEMGLSRDVLVAICRKIFELEVQ